MYCGIDLAVKRKTAIGVLREKEIKIIEATTDEKIIEICKHANIVAIDSPLSHSKGFRKVDKEMIKRGFKVLPPSFMVSLVDRAIRLSKELKVIETHPTSSLKNIGLNWKDLHDIKDYVDAAICAITAMEYDNSNVEEISADDGTIYLLPKKFRYSLKKKDFDTFVLCERTQVG